MKRSINEILDGDDSRSFAEWLALVEALREARDVLLELEWAQEEKVHEERINGLLKKWNET